MSAAPHELRRGFLAGAADGLLVVAVLYVTAGWIGLQPLPELLQEPLLAVMPGPLFGFLIDTLQHAGKVLEEAGLILAQVLLSGALGAGYTWLRPRVPAPAAVTGAVGWVVVVAILLPLSGQQLLGLRQGIVQPVYWAVLMGLYAAILPGLYRSLEPAPAEADPERRRVITSLPLGLAAASAVVLGFRLVPGWVGSALRPPESGLAGLSPAITPVRNFYLVSKNFQDPQVPARGWTLRVDGLAGNPLALDYTGLQKLPAASEYVTLECISNDVGGALISTGLFTGVRLKDLVALAQPQAGATAVNFTAADDYSETLPLSTVQASPEILVAYQLDGRPLPSAHGFPARILIPGRYGMKGPKWLRRIELAAEGQGGYWEGEGWSRDAVVKTTSRIDAPQDGALVRLGPVAVGGIAFAGKRGISMVEVSTDAGATWRTADVQQPLSPFTWSLWRFAWHPAQEGDATLVVRARDGSGALQTPSSSPSFPGGASGYHTVRITVSR